VNHFPNPVRGTLALPDDIDLADIDWSPVNAVEKAAAPHRGRVVRPAEHGRGKHQPTHVQPDDKPKRPKTYRHSMTSDKQQATCPGSLAAQVKGSAQVSSSAEASRGGLRFPAKRPPKNRAPRGLSVFPVCAANGI